jgi:signal transduction histidine kinase
MLRLARAGKAKLIEWDDAAPLLIILVHCLSGVFGILLVLWLQPQTSLSRFLLSLVFFFVLFVIEFEITRRLLSQWLATKKSRKSKASGLSIESTPLPDRIIVFDKDGRYQIVFGRPSIPDSYPFPNLEGRLIHEVFDKEFTDFCLNIIQTVLATNSPQIVEYSRAHKGVTYNLEAHIAPFFDAVSGNRYVAWVSREVSSRKKFEDSLRESERRLRAFVQALPDRVVILDAEGKYHDVLMSQYDKTSMANYGGEEGQSIYEVFNKDVADFFVAKVRETLEKQETLIFEYDIPLESETYHMEGRTVPYKDPLTFEPLVIWMARDISASKEILKSLEDSEQLLRSIIGIMPDRTNVFDSNGIYLSILQLGLENHDSPSISEDRIGRSIQDFFPQKFADYCLEMLKKTAAENTMQVFEYTSPIEEGRFFEGRTIPFTNPRTGETNILWISRDISIGKQLEKQRIALALQEEKLEFFKQFVDNLTHDLKTPLSIIKTNLYLLQKSPDESQMGRRYIAIDAQVTLLRQMIDDMLTIGRLESISVSHQRHLDLNETLEKIISSLRPNAEKKSQSLEFASHLLTAPTSGLDSELRRAFTNLIENAINYTPNEGKIAIRLEANDSEYLISIKDTGIGIKEEELPHIFERFYRSEKARFAASGTGLGLAISQRIIELHHGTIRVESIENQGSTFIVSLPIHKLDEKAIP